MIRLFGAKKSLIKMKFISSLWTLPVFKKSNCGLIAKDSCFLKVRILTFCALCHDQSQRMQFTNWSKSKRRMPISNSHKQYNYHCILYNCYHNKYSNVSYFSLYHGFKSRTRNVNLQKCFFYSFAKSLSSNGVNDFIQSGGTNREVSDSQKKMTLISNILNLLDNPGTFHLQCETKMPDNEDMDFKDTTLEKQLMYRMESWKIDEAICLLKESVAKGASLDSTVLLNMLQQIAELGKVDCLMELHTILNDTGLVSKVKFFQCLARAFYTSGNIIDGMAMLRTNFTEGQDFNDTDTLFTLLGTMIIKDFEHHYDLVEEFVETLVASGTSVPVAKSMLWKCFVLAEKFDKADELIAQNEELRKIIPSQVTSIVQSSIPIDCDKDKVLLWLTKLPYLKDGLKATALHMLIQSKCDENAWVEAIDHLSVATDNGYRIHQETLKIFLTTFFDKLSNDDLEYWESILDESTNS